MYYACALCITYVLYFMEVHNSQHVLGIDEELCGLQQVCSSATPDVQQILNLHREDRTAITWQQCLGINTAEVTVPVYGVGEEFVGCSGSAAEASSDGVDQLLKLYKEEREQLSKDVLYYKQSCKELKRRLKAEVRSAI